MSVHINLTHAFEKEYTCESLKAYVKISLLFHFFKLGVKIGERIGERTVPYSEKELLVVPRELQGVPEELPKEL